MTNPAAALSVVLLMVAGCGIPHDPRGTLERAKGGKLLVGATASAPWVSFRNDEPEGIEVDLVRGLAHELDATVHWRRGSETELLESVERGELPLVIGGLKASTPWSRQVALTQPYFETPNGYQHVMAVPQGENRWLLELERYLQAQRESVRVRYRAETKP